MVLDWRRNDGFEREGSAASEAKVVICWMCNREVIHIYVGQGEKSRSESEADEELMKRSVPGSP
jgi:hypothetical protein